MSTVKWIGIVGVMAVFLVPSVRSDACHLRELDICSATVAGIKSVPVNDDEVDKACGLAKEAFECFTGYADKCTTPVQKELLSYALGNGHKEKAEQFCTKGNDLRVAFLKHAPCLAKAQAEGKRCVVDGQAALEKLEEVPFQDKITTACCAYVRYKKCVHGVVDGTCGAEAIAYGDGMIRMLTANLVDVVCQGFETNAQCDTLLPPPGTPPKGNGKSLIGKLIAAYSKS